MATIREAGVQSVSEVRAFPRRLVRFDEASRATNTALKQFLRKNVYYTPRLIDERKQSSAQIAKLFHFYLDHPGKIPARDGPDPVHRVVCDYIAGMTDGYFRRVYAEFLGA